MLVEYTPEAPRWQAALAKAEALAVNRVTYGRTMDSRPDEAMASWFYVASATAEGEHYTVVVNQFAGDVATSCTCKAGEFGRPCWHQAACVQRLGLVPSPTPEPLRYVTEIDTFAAPFADLNLPEGIAA